MPDRSTISQFLRPRNLRVIVVALAVGSLLLTVVYIFGGLFLIEESSPTIQARLEPKLGSTEDGIQLNDISSHSVDSVERARGYWNDTGDYDKPGTCRPIPEFTPELDSNKIYPSLGFDDSWVGGKDYWNTFFEERYKKVKESNATPYLKVFVIPHSHTDPGWLLTFEGYFEQKVRNIIDNAVDKLEELPMMKFQLSEISFLAKWYKYAHPSRRDTLKKLVKEGRLEIATGGWTMTDEAGVNLYSMIDQLVEGHQWVKTHLDVIPKTSWSIDPFGHGSTFPYILNAAGLDGMIIQRIHYAWKKYFAEHQKGDFKWVQRWDSGNKHSILCHNAPFDIYSIKHSCGPTPQICLNFDFRSIIDEYAENSYIMQPITKNNLKDKAELLLEQYARAASLFPHNVALVSLGDDFRYNHAIEWNQQYYNYLALFNYINAHKDKYKAELQFGTISDYFKAVRQRTSTFPTFSGDFFVYSDIFSEGRPAYWSGYFGTRPYWKKFYRETENAVRSAEILYTIATAHARQNKQINTLVIMNREYEHLEVARQWLALFSHHDAVTGTSKANTMDDYGHKLLEAKQNSLKIQQLAINSLLFGGNEHSHLSMDNEQATFELLPKKVPLKLTNDTVQEKKVILFNNLGWKRSHLAKVIITTPHVRVIGPNGEPIASQLNPIMDLSGPTPAISPSTFELSFIASLPPLSISTFTIKKTLPGSENMAIPASVYCANCTGLRGLFEINSFEAGNIQLTSDRVQLLFDRSTGFLLGIKMLNDNIAINSKLSYGSYKSIEFRSGAYLLKVDTRSVPEPIPFSAESTKIFIISGQLFSELSVASDPLLTSTQIMHAGGLPFEDGIYIQNKINLGRRKGEIFMRFDTDLDSRTTATDGDVVGPTPTFYTDQNGFTIEKRTKVSKINLEGNYYPVNTVSYLQDESRGIRFSVLVDRAHGFSSYENGRLETLIERRTVYDDARGMGEGVTDNRETISNYVILVEKILPATEQTSGNGYHNLVPTITVHHTSLALNYPPSLFVLDYENFPKKFPLSQVTTLLSKQLPCDTHLINVRTMSEDKKYDVDTILPSRKALLIVQKLAYYCKSGETNKNTTSNCGAENGRNSRFFYPGTTLTRVNVRKLTETALTGIDNSTFRDIRRLEDVRGDPFQIKSIMLQF